MSYGKMLRYLRGNKTKKQVAQELGITESSWAKYERNERTPRDELKVKIADYFGRSVQEIFFGSNEHI